MSSIFSHLDLDTLKANRDNLTTALIDLAGGSRTVSASINNRSMTFQQGREEKIEKLIQQINAAIDEKENNRPSRAPIYLQAGS